MENNFAQLAVEAFGGQIPQSTTVFEGDGTYAVDVDGIGRIKVPLTPEAEHGYQFLGWEPVRTVDALAFAVANPLLVAPEVRSILFPLFGLSARKAAHEWWLKTFGA